MTYKLPNKPVSDNNIHHTWWRVPLRWIFVQMLQSTPKGIKRHVLCFFRNLIVLIKLFYVKTIMLVILSVRTLPDGALNIIMIQRYLQFSDQIMQIWNIRDWNYLDTAIHQNYHNKCGMCNLYITKTIWMENIIY